MNINRNLHSKTALTEFAREFEDSKDTVLSKLVNKIYDACNNVQQEPSTSQVVDNKSSSENSSCSSESSSAHPAPPSPTESVSAGTSQNVAETHVEYQVDTSLGRTPLNVVKRISNLLAMKDKDLGDYKNSELQKLWMPDSKSRECYDCSVKFNTFRRKHHCRLCGQIFCSKCCNQIIPGKIIKCSGDLRVCNYCSKVVLLYLKSSDINADLKSDLQALEDDLSSKFVAHANITEEVSSIGNRSPHRKVSLGYQEERLVSNPNILSNADRKSILQQSNSLKTLYEEMLKKLTSQNKGIDLVNFLLSNQKFANRQQAVAVLNAMIEGGFISPVITYDTTEGVSVEDAFHVEFNENLWYILPKIEDITESRSVLGALKRSESANDDLDIDNIMPLSITSESLYSNSNEKDLQSSILSTVGSKPLLEAYCEHEELLLNQLLRSEKLDSSWSKVLINQCARIAHTIHPEYCQNDQMDVRSFVNIKKISSGSKNECTIVGGVVFTKNVSHKDMNTKIDNPKILLVQCPIAYQRVEGKFVTIDSLILQEKEYLRNVTARILSYGPDVVLVHKNVAGIAQDMLRHKGITLVLDVKLSVFERLAQCMKCDIVTSIDSNIGTPKLGSCKRFFTKSFEDENGLQKTLMFFDIPYSQRGCSLLLRGGNEHELSKVKKVAAFLLYARYNFRLELSYLLDVFAQPPPSRTLCESIFDSVEASNVQSEDCEKVAMRSKDFQEPLKVEIHKKERSVNIENVADFSDPLRTESLSPDIINEENVELEVQHPFDNKFRASLSSTVLSISPFINFPLPYLETETGRKCALRALFPAELFYSKHWSEKSRKSEIFTQPTKSCDVAQQSSSTHEFLKMKFTSPVDHKDIQTALSDYRRSGGQYEKVLRMKKIERKSENEKQKVQAETIKDAMDVYCHQRLPVLFCSFYYNTRELPTSFCAQPLLLNMHFYGYDDIMLGLFLERYCFRSSYICSSCKLPMMNHVRKYAHSMGVVTVKLSEDPIRNENSNILFTSRCTICNTMTPRVTISNDTWCLSFAKFLELKFHGHSYTRRSIEDDTRAACNHSLHRDHIQYFSSNGVIASFSYAPVDIWEIKLPFLTLQLKASELIDKKYHSERIKSMSVKGYEVYAKIHEKLANLSSDDESAMVTSLKKVLNRDQLIFKHRVEVVYTLLSSSEIYATEIDDAMFMMNKELADSIELWGPRLSAAAIQSKNSNQKNDSAHPPELTEENDEDLGAVELDLDAGIMTRSSDDIHVDKKDKFDKNTIKRLLSTLLPSSSDQNPLTSPFPSNDHYCLPSGLFPVLVQDQDLSSIIAYSIMSYDYKKALEAIINPTLDSSIHSNSSPSLRRKIQSDASAEVDEKDFAGKESNDLKKKQSSNHVEVHFQDASPCQFTCKIYLAKEFDDLRSGCFVLPKQKAATADNPSQDSKAQVEDVRKYYARSLSKSQKWEARGGKSGSKFSKTSDDRFILKEMSKQDVGEFEKFAPHYFAYVNECIQKKTPTLLAKIFGVYKVIVKKEKESAVERSVLVMENLFCDRKIVNKYDLKGSERNRMVDPSGQNGETVLLDENLIQGKNQPSGCCSFC